MKEEYFEEDIKQECTGTVDNKEVILSLKEEYFEEDMKTEDTENDGNDC